MPECLLGTGVPLREFVGRGISSLRETNRSAGDRLLYPKPHRLLLIAVPLAIGIRLIEDSPLHTPTKQLKKETRGP